MLLLYELDAKNIIEREPGKFLVDFYDFKSNELRIDKDLIHLNLKDKDYTIGPVMEEVSNFFYGTPLQVNILENEGIVIIRIKKTMHRDYRHVDEDEDTENFGFQNEINFFTMSNRNIVSGDICMHMAGKELDKVFNDQHHLQMNVTKNIFIPKFDNAHFFEVRKDCLLCGLETKVATDGINYAFHRENTEGKLEEYDKGFLSNDSYNRFDANYYFNLVKEKLLKLADKELSLNEKRLFTCVMEVIEPYFCDTLGEYLNEDIKEIYGDKSISENDKINGMKRILKRNSFK